jgi:hypothetical protein
VLDVIFVLDKLSSDMSATGCELNVNELTNIGGFAFQTHSRYSLSMDSP